LHFYFGQLCDELRSLDVVIVRLKSYIDQLLAVALESNPSLLEGMPRIQQNSGLKIELFRVASIPEVIHFCRLGECSNLVYTILCVGHRARGRHT
jgi:hypothetical protein